MGLIQEISRNGALDEAKAEVVSALVNLCERKQKRWDDYKGRWYPETVDLSDVEEIFADLLNDIEGLKE